MKTYLHAGDDPNHLTHLFDPDEVSVLDAATQVWLELLVCQPDSGDGFKTQIFVVESDAPRPQVPGLAEIDVPDDKVFCFDCSTGWAKSLGSITPTPFIPSAWIPPEDGS